MSAKKDDAAAAVQAVTAIVKVSVSTAFGCWLIQANSVRSQLCVHCVNRLVGILRPAHKSGHGVCRFTGPRRCDADGLL